MKPPAPLSLPMVLLLLTGTGCVKNGVSLRADRSPGPEDCSARALDVMEILRIRVGDAANVELDLNQADTSPITLYEGEVESELTSSLGTLDVGTRLYGRVWTEGPMVVVRYYGAKDPREGPTLPICAVARLALGQMRKRPESKPGTAILESSGAAIFIVDRFR